MKPIAPTLVTAFMLCGCSSMPRMDPGEKACSSNDTCVVTVTARGCSWQAIAADPEVLHVKRGYKGTVRWVLNSPPGWAFAENGIEFKDSPGEEFGEKRGGERNFSFANRNTKPGVYRYNVNLTPPGGGKTCTLDPTVMNDGEGP
jgi:hypothetical protein